MKKSAQNEPGDKELIANLMQAHKCLVARRSDLEGDRQEAEARAEMAEADAHEVEQRIKQIDLALSDGLEEE